MNRIPEWDNVQAVRGGNFTPPAGGYIGKIKGVKLTKSKAGKDMLVFTLDIAEGEFAGYFTKRYERRLETNENAKYPANGLYRQVVEGDSLGRFKGLIMALEESNPKFEWNWDESKLVGLRVGLVIREKEFYGDDSQLRTTIEITDLRAVEGIEDIPAPAKKTINGDMPVFGGTVDNSDVPF